MYHSASELIQKIRVIDSKADELKHLMEYMASHKTMVTIDMDRLESEKEFLILDIQSLCREIANDTGGTHE